MSSMSSSTVSSGERPVDFDNGTISVGGPSITPRPPQGQPVVAALAAVTEHIGLVGTINSTFNEPFELAREFASLDHLSGCRAGWNVVTSFDTFTGANFRKGGHLPREQRYERAEATAFHRDINERVEKWGRTCGDVKIVPSVGIVLGDREERVRELQQYAEAHRGSAPSGNLSLREAFIGLQAAPDLVGTPEKVAGALDDFVQQDASDGFVIGSPVVPSGIDEFVDKVVPLLQERGSLREDYEGSTLRSNLDIPVPERGATTPAVFV